VLGMLDDRPHGGDRSRNRSPHNSRRTPSVNCSGFLPASAILPG
jgi:hypothetical protein